MTDRPSILDFNRGDRVRDLSGLAGKVVGFSVREVHVEWECGFRSYLNPRYLTLGERGGQNVDD